MKIFTTILLLFVFVMPGNMQSPVCCQAQKSRADTVARDLRTVNDQIVNERREKERAYLSQGSILQELDGLNRWYDALRGELKGLAEDVKEVTSQVALQEAEAARLEQSLKELLQKFSKRLKIRYCQPPGKWLDFLDSDADLTEKFNALVYGRRVLEADRRLQSSCAALLADVRGRRRKLHERQSFLVQIEQQQARKVAELEENIAKKNELLYKIQHQVKAHEELVAELEKVAEKLQEMTHAKRSPAADFALLKGSLPMPVEGVVTAFFGLEKDSRFATVTSNKGIEIKARFGDPVRVIYGGQVVFASWMKGYGKLLVVDHGGGYYSIYGHLEEFICKVNDQLQATDIVGRVGRGAFSESASLYFEIRKGGVPEDPLTWVSQL